MMLALPEEVRTELELARERKEPNLVWQYIVGVAFFLSANLVMALVAVLVQLLATGELVAMSWPGLPVGMVMYAAAAVALNLLLVRWLAQRRMLEFSRPGWLAEFAAGLGIGAALISVSVAILALLGVYRVDGVQLTSGLLVGIGIGIGAGFAEEILFRGVLLRLLDKNVGSWAAIAIVSVLFGLLHLTNPGAGLRGAVALIVEAGLILCGAYLLTRRLWLVVGIHIAWNATMAAVYGLDVSGTGIGTNGGLLVSTMTGPDWLTGGSMGIEGSVVTILVALAAGAGILVVAHRRGNLRPRVGRDAPVVDMRPTRTPPTLMQ